MLNYLHEALEARQATSARRRYGYISAAIIVLLILAAVFWNMPLWPVFVIAAGSFALDVVLMRKWANKDLLNQSRVQP